MPSALPLLVVVVAGALDGGPEFVAWNPAPTVGGEAVRRAARESLRERWTASDGALSMRRPVGFEVVPTSGDTAELGRFVSQDSRDTVIRVGYVAGPILGDPGEMVTVVHNVAPRLAQDGSHVAPTSPHRAEVGGQPAMFSELTVTPPGAEQPSTVHFYAYVANGQLPGVMLHAVAPAARMPELRPVLLACLASLGTAVVRPAAPGREPPPVEEEVPDAVPFPAFLVVTVLLGAVLLRVFSRLGA